MLNQTFVLNVMNTLDTKVWNDRTGNISDDVMSYYKSLVCISVLKPTICSAVNGTMAVANER